MYTCTHVHVRARAHEHTCTHAQMTRTHARAHARTRHALMHAMNRRTTCNAPSSYNIPAPQHNDDRLTCLLHLAMFVALPIAWPLAFLGQKKATGFVRFCRTLFVLAKWQLSHLFCGGVGDRGAGMPCARTHACAREQRAPAQTCKHADMRTGTRMCVCVCVRARTRVRVRAQARAQASACTHACLHACVRALMCAYCCRCVST
jgi:hypothetical protein